MRSIGGYFVKPWVRYLSISKSNLIESSQKIEKICKGIEEKNSILKCFAVSIKEIHREYPSIKIGTSTKNIYQQNSSKLNWKYLQLENDRKKPTEFPPDEELILLLRYVRFVQVAFIYRFITFDIRQTLKETSQSILRLTKDRKNLKIDSLPLLCELNFFVKYFSSENCLSQVKSVLSQTFIPHYLSENLFRIFSKENSILLVEELCSTLHTIVEIPSSIDLWPLTILKYLHQTKSCSLPIIDYLIFIQHNCLHPSSNEFLLLFNEYLIEHGISQSNLEVICQLMILISSANYSHQLFHQEVLEKIGEYLKNSKEINVKLCCRLISYLCLNDPTNRFQSRSTIVELSRSICEDMDQQMNSPQWIVQAQHGMMCANIYNYQLLFSMVQQKVFPALFRDLGVYSSTIYRQLFDIHYALMIDRPTLKTNLLNDQMLSFATKISTEYRSSILPTQKSYNRFLNELNHFFNHTYGDQTSRIIHYPYLLFHFLELNLPDTDELRAIGINTKQRIGILPVLNSMLIRQQRSNGSFVRVLSAHTTMRYRLIEKNNYQVLPIFHGEYLRAIKDKQMKNIFQTNLALKSLPRLSDHL